MQMRELLTPTPDSSQDMLPKCDHDNCTDVAVYGNQKDGRWCDKHYWSQGDNPYAGFGERFY